MIEFGKNAKMIYSRNDSAYSSTSRLSAGQKLPLLRRMIEFGKNIKNFIRQTLHLGPNEVGFEKKNC